MDLFIENTGDIYVEDIYELILEDKNFQPCILDPSLDKKLAFPVPQEVKKKMLHALKNFEILKRALASHDLFKQLSGNPMSTKIVA